MSKVWTVHLAGKRAYLMPEDPDNKLTKKHAKALRRMLRLYLKIIK